LPLETSPWIRLLIFDWISPGDVSVVLVLLLELLVSPLCSEELMSVSAEDSAL
jgi:hypothetical protein